MPRTGRPAQARSPGTASSDPRHGDRDGGVHAPRPEEHVGGLEEPARPPVWAPDGDAPLRPGRRQGQRRPAGGSAAPVVDGARDASCGVLGIGMVLRGRGLLRIVSRGWRRWAQAGEGSACGSIVRVWPGRSSGRPIAGNRSRARPHWHSGARFDREVIRNRLAGAREGGQAQLDATLGGRSRRGRLRQGGVICSRREDRG